jgi:hypothetical protein
MEELHETQQYAARSFDDKDRRQAQCAYEGNDRRKADHADDRERLAQQEQLRQQDQDHRPETD